MNIILIKKTCLTFQISKQRKWTWKSPDGKTKSISYSHIIKKCVQKETTTGNLDLMNVDELNHKINHLHRVQENLLKIKKHNTTRLIATDGINKKNSQRYIGLSGTQNIIEVYVQEWIGPLLIYLEDELL